MQLSNEQKQKVEDFLTELGESYGADILTLPSLTVYDRLVWFIEELIEEDRQNRT